MLGTPEIVRHPEPNLVTKGDTGFGSKVSGRVSYILDYLEGLYLSVEMEAVATPSLSTDFSLGPSRALGLRSHVPSPI